MFDNWYVEEQGAVKGPFEVHALMEMAESGEIGPNTSVKKKQIGPWQQAKEFEFFAVRFINKPSTTYVATNSIPTTSAHSSPTPIPPAVPAMPQADTAGWGWSVVVLAAFVGFFGWIIIACNSKTPTEAKKPTKTQYKFNYTALLANSTKNQVSPSQPVQATQLTPTQLPPASSTQNTSSASAVSIKTPKYTTSPTTPTTSAPYTTKYYDYNYRPPVGENYVNGYVRQDGTYISGHYRTNRDDSFWNNYSSRGNLNPHTYRLGTKSPRR